MGRPLAASETPAALLLALAVLLAVAASVRGTPWKSSRASAAVGSQVPAEEPQLPREQGANDAAAGGKPSQLRPPAVLRGGVRKGGEEGADEAAPARGLPAAGIPVVSYLSGGREEEENETGLCPGCPRRPGRAMAPLPEPEPLGGEKPAEAVPAGGRVAQPVQGEAGSWKPLGRGGGPGSPSRLPGSPEELGSGDQHGKGAAKQLGFAEWSTIPPSLASAGKASAPGNAAPGPGSAEADVLPGPIGATGLPSPALGRPVQTPEGARRAQEQDAAPKEDPLESWADSSSSSLVEGAEGRTELTWLDVETPQSVVTPPLKAAPKPSLDPLASEIIDIDYYDLFDGEGLGGPSMDSTKQKPPEDKEVSWAFRDLYDDFTPFDESDFYPTTSFYTDGDEEDLEETEEEEEEEEEDEGGGGLARGLEEKGHRGPTLAPPKIQTGLQGAAPTSHRYIVPPLQTFVIAGGRAVATPRPRPSETGREGALPVGIGENGTECRSGYIRHNASCKSLCDTFPSYCLNGGQCYLVENLGAFCRCNTQDYIWHKGVRCESIITDFQVMCVAVGSAALVVLLLFMMTVVFAKKLYLLKTENNKLRKSKYRTPSELHNDNFSLSTIAEGSHPNARKCCDTPCKPSPHAPALAYCENIICQDDSSGPHKLQDPLKSCLKDEEPLNIQNSLSLSPKLDSGKGNADYPDVNCLQNNLT